MSFIKLFKNLFQIYRYGNFTPWLLSVIVIIIFFSCTEEEYQPVKQDPLTIERDSVTKSLISEMNKDTLRLVVKQLENYGTRFALAGNRKTIALSLEERFKKIGLTDTRIDSFRIAPLWQGQQYVEWHYNVSAHLHGKSSPDSLIVIGAHYDAIATDGNPFITAPGADDNASGVSAVFEIARVMSAKKFRHEYSINFVLFGAEEFDLAGSKVFAENSKNRGDRISMMINLDMIGYEISTQTAKWKINIINYPNSLTLMERAYQSCSGYSLLLPVTDNKPSQSSDSYSFYNKGYRAIYYASPNTNPNYHSTKDLSAQLNFNYCLEVVKAACAMVIYFN